MKYNIGERILDKTVVEQEILQIKNERIIDITIKLLL